MPVVLGAWISLPERTVGAERWLGSESASGRSTVLRQYGFEAVLTPTRTWHSRQLSFSGYPEAIRYCRRSLQLDPNHLGARRTIGRLLTDLGELDNAEWFLDAALRQAPEDPESLLAMAALESRRGKPEQAIEHVQQAVTVAPAFSRASFTLGTLYEHQKRPELAIRAYREALCTRPADWETHCRLGRLYRWKGRNLEASDHFRYACLAAPTNELELVRLADCLTEDSGWSNAVEVLTTGLRRAPTSSLLQTRLAWLLATCPRRDDS